jgi:GT2 family glycosyltransferase
VAGSYEVSCIIPCYHRAELLRGALARLTDPRLEIVVVNGETDPDVARVAEPYVHVPRKESGFCSGVNLGARRVSSDYVLFMNDDILIDVDDVLRLRETVASGQADVAVPAILNPQGALEPTIRALPTPSALFREWFLFPESRIGWLQKAVGLEKWRRPKQTEQIQAAGTPVIATSTALLRTVPLPEDYLLNWDEIEWFWRLREGGKSVLYVPDTHAVHLGGGPQDISAFKSRLMTTNAVRCVRRTQGRGAARVAFFVVLLYNLRLVTVAALRRVTRRERSRGELAARIAGILETRASWREAG